MRCPVFAFGLLLGLSQADAQTYAQYLIDLADQVAHTYVRPVSQADLLAAALTGLSEAVQAPVPANLKADLQSAGTPKDLQALITRLRAALNDAPLLKEPNGLLLSCSAMTKKLDPYSGVVKNEELAHGNGIEQNYGVGIELCDNPGVGPLLIKSVTPGSPAQRAGLRPGDEIKRIGNHEAARTTSFQAGVQLNGVRRAEMVTVGYATGDDHSVRLVIARH